MKKVNEMNEVVRKNVPSTTYTYIRDLVFAAMVSGLILKSVKNSENIATITQQITQHEHWGEAEQKELNNRLDKIEERLRVVEINTNGKNR